MDNLVTSKLDMRHTILLLLLVLLNARNKAENAIPSLLYDHLSMDDEYLKTIV